MKIITWNINGLRALLSKGAWSWLETQDPDVIGLQEIKAKPEQLDIEQKKLFDDWHALWNPAARLGYSGTATFAKNEPQEHRIGLGDPVYDVEGRVIWTRHDDFWLLNIYFPNGQRGQDRVDYKLAFYENLLDQCDHLHAAGEKLIIMGDFNTAHREIDLKNPNQNETTSGFLPEERAMIDRYLEHGFVDIWRKLYPAREQYTWWTYITNARARNIGWRIDYFLISSSLVERVKDVVIYDTVMGSDHCPVELIIN
jgi:exodeoxyribonuclease-3